jgi:hypothetical protein
MSKTISYIDMRGVTQTVTEEKAQQLLTYISKQVSACNETIAAAKQLRDEKAVRSYEDQKSAMLKVSEQLLQGVLG